MALSKQLFERVEQVTYNIGDLIVRYINDKYYWNMIGIITGERQVSGATYYRIKWIDPKTYVNDRWQAGEFELVEIAKKLEQNT